MAKAIAALLIILQSGLNLFSEERTFTDHWDYQVRVTDPGTRYESRVGLIFYKNIKIRFNFDEILIPIGEYKYVQGMRKWGSYGYLLLSSQTSHNFANYTEVEEETKEIVLNRGFYSGKNKYKEINNTWIRVMRNNEYYWVNPENLKALIEHKKWFNRKEQVDFVILPSERLRRQIDRFFNNQ